MKALNRLILIIAMITGCLWFFGSRQPIIDVALPGSCPACSGTGQARCPDCQGFGNIEVEGTCPACGGSGKGDWSFGASDRKRMSDARPPCMKCGGTGRSPIRHECTRCQGVGHITCVSCGGTGKAASGSAGVPKTARAGLSLWERTLALVRIQPDPNAAPQSRAGRYPLVDRYVRLRSGARTYEVVAFKPVRRTGRQWLVPATLREAGRDRLEPLLFIIENRTVQGSRPDA